MRDEITQSEAREARAREAARCDQSAKMAVSPINTFGIESGACRQSARAVLEQRRDGLLREAQGIEALLQALPGSMGHVAEEALWKIVVDQRR